MFVLYREKYQNAQDATEQERCVWVQQKRKIEVRHYIIGIAVFVVAVTVGMIVFFLGIQSDDS